jgi:hypothetical protein
MCLISTVSLSIKKNQISTTTIEENKAHNWSNQMSETELDNSMPKYVRH